jgi:hypothetical protein
LPPAAVAEAILDPAISSRPAASSFSNVKEMTMLLEQLIEELRAELRTRSTKMNANGFSKSLLTLSASLLRKRLHAMPWFPQSRPYWPAPALPQRGAAI